MAPIGHQAVTRPWCRKFIVYGKRRGTALHARWAWKNTPEDFKLDLCCYDGSALKPCHRGLAHASVGSTTDGKGFVGVKDELFSFSLFKNVSPQWTSVFQTFGKFSFTPFLKRSIFCIYWTLTEKDAWSRRQNFSSLRRLWMAIYTLRHLPSFQSWEKFVHKVLKF